MADETYRYDVVIGVDVVADGVDMGLKGAEQSMTRWERKSIESIKKVQAAMDLLSKNGFNQKLTQDMQKFILMSEKLNRSYIQTSKARESADSQAARNKIKQNELVQSSDLRLQRLQDQNLRNQRRGEEEFQRARLRFVQNYIAQREKEKRAEERFQADKLKAAQNYQIGEQRLINQQIQNQLRLEREERRISNAREAQRKKELRERERTLNTRVQGASAAGNGMLAAGTAMTAAITAPVVAGLIQSVKVGSQYEQSMNMLQAVTNATAEQMRQADEAAMKLGNDLTLPGVSAKDAAEAMTELGKAGLNVQQSIDAANGTLKLSIAANIGAAQAAEIVSNALNMFGLEAKEAGRIADLLAAAANASSAEVTDVADALKQAGAVFANAKVPIEDVVTLIGELANQGIKGSDAGTSLKTMIQRLQSPSKDAAAAMKALNIEIYDQQGKMKPMREIIAQFEKSLTGLTQKQKDQALNTIFGSDAVRAAAIVFSQGAAGFDKMKEAVMRTNAATELAAARTKGLAGAWDALTSQLETIGLIVYNRIKKPLTEVVMFVATFISQLTDGFLSLPEPIQVAVAGFVAIISALGPLIALVGGLTVALSSAVPGLLALTGATTVGAALATLGPIILGIIVVIGALVAAVTAVIGVIYALSNAWDNGWGEIASVVAIAIGAIISAISPIIGLPILIGSTLYTIYKLWESNFGNIRDFTTKYWGIIKDLFKGALNAILGLVNTIGGRILDWWRSNGDQTKSLFTSIYNYLFNVVKNFLVQIDQFWTKYGATILRTVSVIWNMIKDAILYVLNIILDGFTMWTNIFQGNWEGAWKIFLSIVKRAAYGLAALWKFMLENSVKALIWLALKIKEYGDKAALALIKAIAAGIVWLVKAFINLPFTLIKLIPSFIAAGKQIGNAIWEGLKEAFSSSGQAPVDAQQFSAPFDILKIFDVPETLSAEGGIGSTGGVLDKINDKLNNINDTIGNIGNSSKKSSVDVGALNDVLDKTGGKKKGSSKKKKATGIITDRGESILEAADILGVSGVDLATLISYETSGTFSTSIKGPTITNKKSKYYGDHGLGLIQFMKDNRKTYGVKAGQSFDVQMQAVIKYLQDRGVKPGADLMSMYKAVNGGNVNRSENASDGYGTIRSHVGKMQRDHRKSAIDKLFGGKVPTSAGRTGKKDPTDEFEVNPEIERLRQLKSAQKDVIKTYQEMKTELDILGFSQESFGSATLEQAQASLEKLDKVKDAQKFLNSEYSKSTEKLEEMNAAVDGNLSPLQEFDLSIQRMAKDLGVSTDKLKEMNPNLEKTRENLQKIADKQLADKAAANLKEFIESIGADIKDLDTKIALAGVTDEKKKRAIEAKAELDKILSSDKFKNASPEDRATVEGEFWSRYLRENKLAGLEKAAAATELYKEKVKELNDSLIDTDKLTEQQRLEIELTTGSLKDLNEQQKAQLRALQGQVDLIKKSDEARKRIKDIAEDFGGIFADSFTALFDRGVMGALETLGKGLKSFFKNLMMQIVGGIATQVQSSITNMLMKVLTGKGQATQSTQTSTLGGILQTSGGMVIQNLQSGNQNATGSGSASGGMIQSVINKLVPKLTDSQGNSISGIGNNLVTNSLSGVGSSGMSLGHEALHSVVSQSGKFSWGSLGKSFGSMAPMLGMSLGGSLGGQSMGGQILGSIGGLAGGLALGIGTGAIGGAGTALGGMVAALGGTLAATGILAAVAVPLLIGSWLLGRNKKRRQEETVRNQLMLDAFASMDKLIAGVNNNSIDGASAISQAEDIRSQYLTEANKLTDKKTKSHALQDVSRIDAKIATLKAAVSSQDARKSKLANLVPTFKNGGQVRRFADGGSTSKFISDNYQTNPLGYIRGAGTEKSDSILAMVSNREYILDAETTRNIGVGKLDLIRKYKGLNLSKIPRFADGGEFGAENSLNISDTNFASKSSGSAEIKIGVEVVNNITQTDDGFLISTEAYLNTDKGRKQIDNVVSQNILEGRQGGKVVNALKQVNK